MYLFVVYTLLLYLPNVVEVALDYAVLKRVQNKTAIISLSIVNNGTILAYHCPIPYAVVHNKGENNTAHDNDIHSDDRQISYTKMSTILHEAQTCYEHLIADCLRHQQMLLPLLADTPTFPQIERFRLPTTTGTEIRIILCFLQRKLISMHCASCYTHSLYKRLMYNIQTKTHVTYSTNCNTQNTIFASTLQSVWPNPILSSLQ